jgi:hypothetical protein
MFLVRLFVFILLSSYFHLQLLFWFSMLSFFLLFVVELYVHFNFLILTICYYNLQLMLSLLHLIALHVPFQSFFLF